MFTIHEPNLFGRQALEERRRQQGLHCIVASLLFLFLFLYKKVKKAREIKICTFDLFTKILADAVPLSLWLADIRTFEGFSVLFGLLNVDTVHCVH